MPTDHELGKSAVVRQLDQGFCRYVNQLTRQEPRICGSEAKVQERPAIAYDRIGNLSFHLREVLMRERKPEGIFACFGEEIGKRGGREVVELIDIKE